MQQSGGSGRAGPGPAPHCTWVTGAGLPEQRASGKSTGGCELRSLTLPEGLLPFTPTVSVSPGAGAGPPGHSADPRGEPGPGRLDSGFPNRSSPLPRPEARATQG